LGFEEENLILARLISQEEIRVKEIMARHGPQSGLEQKIVQGRTVKES
jgi:hypothetical protein